MALKHVTQQSPDIIFIGNIRDEPTMRAAITATELGAFVISTFHTINAVQTIIRVVNFFLRTCTMRSGCSFRLF